MFCWPSRRGSSTRKKSKSTDLSSTGGDDEGSITGGSSVGGSSGGGSRGILVKPYKPRKKGKKCSATFKCDLSEALLPPSEECLISLRSASCNSSVRDLHGYHQKGHRGNGNKHFVSSQIIPGSGFGEEDCDSVNNNNNNKKNNSGVTNNNRSAEVLLFYSNNSLSTRNSVADFIENEEFNYKSLWGKDITEWDSRESRCNTLERDSGNKTGKREAGNGVANSATQKEQRLSSAASSPSLAISSCSQQKNKENGKFNKYFDDHDDEPLPSPPPTPPEAKICLSANTSIGSCSYFKYPQSSSPEEEKPIQPSHNKVPPAPFRIHSSTSTSSLSSSCILTPDIIEKTSQNHSIDSTKEKKDLDTKSDSGTQTLPFWQLEFPGILYCTSCRNRSSHDSGIVLNGNGGAEGGVIVQHQEDGSATPLLILAARGHESPGGDSSSGISSSDDNLESLHTPDEEIMLKSLKNSFLHQAIPFQLCNFSINSNSGGNNGSGKDKSNHGGGGGVVHNSSNNPPTNHHHCQSNITNEEYTNSASNNDTVFEHNLKNQQVCHLQHQQQSNNETEKCQLSTEDIPSVTNHQDRNRLGPVGKNYGSTALDANANESEAPLLRGQSNGELDPSGKTCTKVPGAAEPHIADPSANNNTSNHLIINKNKSSHNNRVTSHNQHNTQNSVLVQENSSLKEEVSRLTSVVSDLQEQIGRLTTSGEETKRTLEGCLVESDTRCLALSVVAQEFDKKRIGVYEQLVQQQAENNEWRHRLDEKLTELQKLQSEYEKEREQHQEDFRAITARHEVEVEVTVKNCENKLEQLQKRHDETLAELKRSHTDELERLQESQRQELDQTIQKHRELLDQHRNQSPHDILHKEVESLQVVVEMRNEEIRVLRKDLMDYKTTLNDLQMAREHGKSLLAKIEDLEAQLEKARADKRSLQERYQVLENNLQQIESENNRLVRNNEELSWKMKSSGIVEN